MSLFDDIRAKAEELMGGAGDQVNTTVEDATTQLGDVSDQVTNAKDTLQPNENADENR